MIRFFFQFKYRGNYCAGFTCYTHTNKPEKLKVRCDAFSHEKVMKHHHSIPITECRTHPE